MKKITLFHRPLSRVFEVVYYSRPTSYDSDRKTYRSRITDRLAQQRNIHWDLSELRVEVTAFVIFPSSQTFNFLQVDASWGFCMHHLQISHISHGREAVDSLFVFETVQFLPVCVTNGRFYFLNTKYRQQVICSFSSRTYRASR